MAALPEIQRVFDVAYYVLCDEIMAWDTVIKGYEQRELQAKYQNRLDGRAPTRPSRLRRLPEHHLQDALYLELDKQERAQEQHIPALLVEDQIIRYLKSLIWHTSKKDACRVAVGLGHFLYPYSLQEIGELHPGWPPAKTFERSPKDITDWIKSWIESRFKKVITEVRMRELTEGERKVVLTALQMFTPWWPSCDPDVTQPRTYGEQLMYLCKEILPYFGGANDPEPPETLWTQIHFLVHPCVGVGTLIQAVSAWINTRELYEIKKASPGPDPDLRVPEFPPPSAVSPADVPPPDDPGTSPPRTAPPRLTSRDLHSLHTVLAHNQHRRHHYRVGADTLMVQVDGQNSRPWEPAQPLDMSLPLTAAYVELYGQDTEGPLRLAVFPLPALDEDMEPIHQHLTLEGQQTVEFTLAVRYDTATGEIVGSSLHLTYEEPVPQPLSVPAGDTLSLGQRLRTALSRLAALHEALAPRLQAWQAQLEQGGAMLAEVVLQAVLAPGQAGTVIDVLPSMSVLSLQAVPITVGGRQRSAGTPHTADAGQAVVLTTDAVAGAMVAVEGSAILVTFRDWHPTASPPLLLLLPEDVGQEPHVLTPIEDSPGTWRARCDLPTPGRYWLTLAPGLS